MNDVNLYRFIIAMTYDVFISYSRKDTIIADRICAAFDKAGISYFIDRQGIAGGMEFPIVLAEAIEDSRLFLFLASDNSYKSKFTNNEVLYAFNEKPHNSLLPYIIDGSQMPRELKFTFASINIRNIKEHPIDTILVDDVLRLLGRMPNYTSSTNTNQRVLYLCDLVRSGEITLHEAIYHPFATGVSKEELDYLVKVGLTALQNEEYEKSLIYLKFAAYHGHVGAQFELSRIYTEGKGVLKDYRKAEAWFNRAAKQGGYIDPHETWID